MDKLEVANKILELMKVQATISKTEKGWFVRWKEWRGAEHARRWSTLPGNPHCPVWYRQWGHGSTYCAALSDLMRWLQGRSVHRLAVWRYWGSIGLGRENAPAIIELLKEAGWPETADCIHCGKPVASGSDWGFVGKKNGPCHLLAACHRKLSES